MKKVLLIVFSCFLLLSLVSAGATFEQTYTLRVSCEGFTCADVNLTLVFPNSTLWIDNQEMTDNTYFASYDFKPPIRGNYDYYASDGENVTNDYVSVTSTGHDLNQAQAFLYFLITIVLLGLLVLCILGGSRIPMKNVRNEEGEVLKVNWNKYLKIFCWTSAYMVLMAVVFVTWNLIYAYSDWYALSKYFHYLFRLLYAFALPVLIGSIITTLINYISDKKIDKFIQKTGLPYKGGNGF